MSSASEIPIASYHKPDKPSYHTLEYLPLRSITKEVMEKFGVKTGVSESGVPVVIRFPYDTGLKVRRLDKKEFYSEGDMKGAKLFGQSIFSQGCAQAITITEGELDALSAYQMLGPKAPVVSILGASTAHRDCREHYEYLNSFEKIYLCFDSDEPGQRAAREVAKLFDLNKVFHVKLTKHKDANEYLTSGDSEEFRRVWWNARKFVPEGVISSLSEFDAIIDSSEIKAGVPWPFKRIQEMTHGIRTGECVLLTAMEGIGKTEIVRAVEYHLLRTTQARIGVIHLEESKSRTLQGLAGYSLGKAVHLPDSGVSKDEVKDAIHKLVGEDERLHLYSHFGSSDPDVILDTIRFLVSGLGCKYIFLDHITMVVTGLGEDDERRLLDQISTKLAMMVEELDFALIFVSHVNDEGRTRGSRNISKIADLWVHLDRDQQSGSDIERNTTHLTIRKNRYAAQTGPAGSLFFDLGTFTVADYDPQMMEAVPA